MKLRTIGAPQKWVHSFVGDRVVDRLRVHPAKAHPGARNRREGPGEAPAVAVEHRQGPEVDGMVGHVPRDRVGHRVEVRAAVAVDHPLGIAGGAGGVVERKRVPFIVRRPPRELRIAARKERLVLDVPDEVPARRVGIVHVDDERPAFDLLERRADGRRELAIGDDRLRLAVLQDEGHGVRVEAGVDGVDDRAEHRDREGRLPRGGDVRRHDGDGVAAPDPARGEARGEPAAAGPGLGPGLAAVAVDDGGALGIDGGASLEEADRRERSVVRGIRVEVGLVGARAHRSFSGGRVLPLGLRCGPVVRGAVPAASGP